MTEDEAKTKWCPMSRYAVKFREPTEQDEMFRESALVVLNRDSPDHGQGRGNCLASGCMAWRAVLIPNNDKSLKFTGYCGLAGAS
jgi:hypothetical protein